MRSLSIFTAFAAFVLLATPIQAETRDEFAHRIAAAYQAQNKKAAIEGLFHLEGVDADSRRMYARSVFRMLARHDAPTIGFEPLPDGFTPVYVRNGYEYRPNLKLLGFVVINGKSRAPYGLHNGRHFFTGVARTAVNPGGPPDRMVQMMVVGIASPPAQFKGFCDVMQSNGKTRRMHLTDEGRGNITQAIMAQHIVRCEIDNTGGRGTLWVRLQEGKAMVFETKAKSPENSVTYRR